MKRGTKRKREDRDDNNPCESANGMTGVKRLCTTKDEEPQAQQLEESLLMKLPAELRNEIYELVLMPGEDKDFAVPLRGGHSGFVPTCCQLAWEEPGLLRASNQIRRETMSIYYLTRHFSTTVVSHTMDPLYQWLHRIAQQVAGRWPRIHLEILPWRHHKNKHSWLPLVKMAYESTVASADGVFDRFIDLEGDWWVEYDVQLLFDSAMWLGVRAKAGGKSATELESEFNDWAAVPWPSKWSSRFGQGEGGGDEGVAGEGGTDRNSENGQGGEEGGSVAGADALGAVPEVRTSEIVGEAEQHIEGENDEA